MARVWANGRRIAFVPVSNSQVDATLPSNFSATVSRRAFFDPDPVSGHDGSLQAYIRNTSSGWAHIDGEVLPPVVSNGTDTMGAAIDSLPSGHNFGYVVAVLPHSAGPHRGGFAWWDAPERNGITDFARVSLFTDPSFSTQTNIGVWAMEVLHAVTHFGDLYNVSPQPGRYDVMACSCGTHPSSHTKDAIGWLHAGAVRSHSVGASASYTLHAVSLPQPPPPGRATAVQIKAQKSIGHFQVEARLRTDIYEQGGSISQGIPAEGVVVYEVQGPHEVFLRASGLGVGDTFTDSDEGLTVRVTGETEGALTVSIRSNAGARCSELQTKIESLRAALEFETDINIRKQLISALSRALSEFRALHCTLTPVISDTVLTDLFSPPAKNTKPGEEHYRSE